LLALCLYPFPGNVRELENILERATTLCEDGTINRADLQLPAAPQEAIGPALEEAPGTSQEMAPGEVSLGTYMDTIEKDVLIKALEQTRYNKTAAARLLGITFRALRYRLKKLGLASRQGRIP